MKTNKYIIFIFILLFILLFILSFNLFFFYRKKILIANILYAWKQKLPDGNITFDGIGKYKNDYYLALDKDGNFYTHIHFITDTTNCYLCYVAKKNNKHSPLYIIDTNEEPIIIVDKMIDIFNKL